MTIVPGADLRTASAQTNSNALDEVVIQRSTGKPITRKGRILDVTGAELILQTSSSQQQRFPAANVLRFRTYNTPSHVAGRRAMAVGEFSQAMAELQKAAKDERRPWMRREVIADIIRCYRALGRIPAAGDLFLSLLENSPQTPHFDAIPLCWTTPIADAQLEQKASRWLASTNPAAQLLGASWLLTVSRNAAASALNGLASHNDSRIAFLAEAQLWRDRSLTAQQTEIDRWESRLAKMPHRLRAGPQAVVAYALARGGNLDRATVAFLKIPILYPHDYSLATSCLISTGRLLQKNGRSAEARVLYREVLTKSAKGSPVARVAEQLLSEEIQQPR